MEIVSIKIGDKEILYNPDAYFSDFNKGLTYAGSPKPLLERNYKVSCVDSKTEKEILLDIHSFKEIRKGKLELLTTNGNTIEIEGDFEFADREISTR